MDIVETFHTVCCGACAWDKSRVYYSLDFPFSKLSKAKKVSGTPAPPFIGSDPLYNGVLHVAIRQEEKGVVKC